MTGWVPYDAVTAARWDEVSAPQLLPPARELVVAVELAPGETVLDVGTGTGLAAKLAAEAVAPGGTVVGLDPSVAMLDAMGDGRVLRVAGAAPGVPFRAQAFDAIIGNLVLSHVPDYTAALSELAAMLARTGRLAMNAFGPTQSQDLIDAMTAIWAEAGGDDVDWEAAFTACTPWEAHFRDEGALRSAFVDAGLADVRVTERRDEYPFSRSDLVARAANGLMFQRVRQDLGDERWEALLARVQRLAAEQLDDDVLFATVCRTAVGRASG